MIEYIMVKAGVSPRLAAAHVPQWATRGVYRTVYCVLVGFIAILLPFFGGESWLHGTFGALIGFHSATHHHQH